jgi:crotonobetainyl-CoA:carnitine CoA-transferase CaiB-like acyl-CoA transferase
MQRPFEGIRVIDATHVLAGPFAAYQLAVLGADVIKVEHPHDPDQSRLTGSDRELGKRHMGTSYLTQASNKRSLTLDRKQAAGQEIFKKLVATADVLVENYRPGALDALGLGYEAMAALNPRLIYASMSAFGQRGPRAQQTAYDYVIQATSGIMAMTGTPQVNPIKFGSPAIDYATGTTGAFALASALFQRERTGRGQRIDLAMLDVAMILMGSHLTSYLRNGQHPKPNGNTNEQASASCYATRDGLLMLGASNIRQYRRFWRSLGRPDLIQPTVEAREHAREAETALIAELLMARSAAEWEDYFQSRHVPAARVRTMGEALEDPHLESRGVRHRRRNRCGRRLHRAGRRVRIRRGRPARRHPTAWARPAHRRDFDRARLRRRGTGEAARRARHLSDLRHEASIAAAQYSVLRSATFHTTRESSDPYLNAANRKSRLQCVGTPLFRPGHRHLAGGRQGRARRPQRGRQDHPAQAHPGASHA